MTRYLIRSPAIEQMEVEGDLLAYDGDRIHLVAGTAAEIWQTLDGSTTTDGVVELLSHRHGNASEVSYDIRRFVMELIDSGLVDESDAPAGNGVSVPTHVAWTIDGDRVVVADLRSGIRTSLTSTASLAWALTASGVRREELLTEIGREFPDAPPQFEREIDVLIDSLLEQGLYERPLGHGSQRSPR